MPEHPKTAPPASRAKYLTTKKQLGVAALAGRLALRSLLWCLDGWAKCLTTKKQTAARQALINLLRRGVWRVRERKYKQPGAKLAKPWPAQPGSGSGSQNPSWGGRGICWNVVPYVGFCVFANKSNPLTLAHPHIKCDVIRHLIHNLSGGLH